MSEDTHELLRRSTQGDETALEALVQRHLEGLRAFVRRNAPPVLQARESTSDLLQSVCREVLQDAGRFEYRGEQAFLSWLHNAALRKIVDRQRYWGAQRREARRLVRPASADGSRSEGDPLARLAVTLGTPSKDVELSEQVELVQRALATLPERDRRAIELVHLQGLSHAEAAARLGCSQAASRKVLSRALARLSRHLAGPG